MTQRRANNPLDPPLNPPLNPQELHTWRDYIASAEILRNRIDRRLSERSALSLGDYRLLLALSSAPDHTLRSAELAEIVDWDRSRTSHHLRRMEQRSLVARVPCPGEARGVNVTITPAGLDAFHTASEHHLQSVKELFTDALTPEQAQHAGEIAAALLTHLRQVGRPE